MRELFKVDLVKRDIWLLCGLSFLLSIAHLPIEMSELIYYGLLVALYYLLKSNRIIWINFLTFPKSLFLFVTSKIISSFVYTALLYIGYTMFLTSINEFMLSLTMIGYCLFIVSEFLVPDGYVHQQIVNPCSSLGKTFLFFCLLFKENWVVVFLNYQTYIAIFMVCCIGLVLVFQKRQMPIKVCHDLVLENIMPNIRFLNEVSFGKSKTSHLYDGLFDHTLSNAKTQNKWYWLFYASVDLILKELKYLCIAFIILLIFELEVLVGIVMLVMILFVGVHLIYCYKKLKKVKITS